jgi:DNA-binding response OmpR family regulator
LVSINTPEFAGCYNLLQFCNCLFIYGIYTLNTKIKFANKARGKIMKKKKILVIDDDEKLNQLLSEYLAKFGLEVTSFTHPREGLKALKREIPDLVILDIMLPGMDGFEICRTIRQDHSVPIIMLTARGEVTDRIVGLELGADDYIPKPFEPRELVARIQSILRRSSKNFSAEVTRIGDLTIDFNKHHVFIGEKPTDLTTAEFEILKLFVKRQGVVLSRNQILEHLWDIEWDVYNRSVDVLISRLRQKLGDDPRKPRYIKTVWGAGYMFIGEE